MDSKLFRLPTNPNYYGPLQSAAPVDVRKIAARQQIPTSDSRFPGWAAPMSDGRLVTAYDPHCASNIPAGQQFPTKAWMQNNADSIIQLSRKRTSYTTGSVFPLDPTVVPPPSLKVACKTDGCTMTATEAAGGIGMEREGAAAPELFGTFDPTQFHGGMPQAPRVALTTKYEGGRNSLRGLKGPDTFFG